jgi:hypothetical protein
MGALFEATVYVSLKTYGVEVEPFEQELPGLRKRVDFLARTSDFSILIECKTFQRPSPNPPWFHYEALRFILERNPDLTGVVHMESLLVGASPKWSKFERAFERQLISLPQSEQPLSGEAGKISWNAKYYPSSPKLSMCGPTASGMIPGIDWFKQQFSSMTSGYSGGKFGIVFAICDLSKQTSTDDYGELLYGRTVGYDYLPRSFRREWSAGELKGLSDQETLTIHHDLKNLVSLSGPTNLLGILTTQNFDYATPLASRILHFPNHLPDYWSGPLAQLPQVTHVSDSVLETDEPRSILDFLSLESE